MIGNGREELAFSLCDQMIEDRQFRRGSKGRKDFRFWMCNMVLVDLLGLF